MRINYIFFTGIIPFFDDIAQSSAYFLTFAKSRTYSNKFVVVGFNDAHKKVAEELLMCEYIDLSIYKSKVLDPLKAFSIVEPTIIAGNYVHTLTFLNGMCPQSIKHEMQLLPTNINEDSSQYEKAYHAALRIAAALSKNMLAIRINNIWEDPMQHKLITLPAYCKEIVSDTKLDIQHFYFHDIYASDGRSDTYIAKYEENGVIVPKRFVFRKSPSQQCQYALDPTVTPMPKFYNFAFALTDVWKDRHDRSDIIAKLASAYTRDNSYIMPNVKQSYNTALMVDKILFRYFSRNSVLQKSSYKMLPYDVYMKIIAQSKLTLIVPSYDNRCFSLRRMYEALSVGCLPLILDTCVLDIFKIDPTAYEFVKDNLVVTIDEVSNREFLLNKAKQSEYIYNHLMNIPFFAVYKQESIYRNTLTDMKLI